MNDPAADAKAVGLRYVSDEMPGIRREKRGEHFVYTGVDGKRIHDERELQRIKSLAVPPAYTDVWICPIANGHIQATARDARGRKQYRYHKRWREVRDENKFERIISFVAKLSKIRKKVEEDLSLPGLPREKVLATVVELLQTTAIRIGNDEYAKENNSFGLTTLRNRHAKVEGSKVRFSFRGKSGVKHAIDLHDRKLANIIRRCQDLPGQQLFEYIDDDGTPKAVDSADVNEYIREISGDEFSAKDFRTWLGTLTCAALLAECEPCEDEGVTERRKRVNEVVKDVAKRLGNTAAICKKCYIHPAIIDAYTNGEKLTGDESAVLKLLKKAAAQTPQERTHRQLTKSLAKVRAKTPQSRSL